MKTTQKYKNAVGVIQKSENGTKQREQQRQI
jgi:hypothetical protein